MSKWYSAQSTGVVARDTLALRDADVRSDGTVIVGREIRIVKVGHGFKRSSMPQLPDWIVELHITTPQRMVFPFPLPLDLELLNVHDCLNMENLPKLSLNLKRLWVSECPMIEDLPELHEGMTDLKLETCNYITELPTLPDSITDLELTDCNGLESLTKLPAGLIRLWIRRCKLIEKLPQIPIGAHSIKLVNLPGMHTITDSPILGVYVLMCSHMPALLALPESFPITLIDLKVHSCDKLKAVSKLPDELKIFSVESCPLIDRLPPMPRSLLYFTVASMPKLNRLPRMPDGLLSLRYMRCPLLTEDAIANSLGATTASRAHVKLGIVKDDPFNEARIRAKIRVLQEKFMTALILNRNASVELGLTRKMQDYL